MAGLDLSTDIKFVKGVGPRRAEDFYEAGLRSVEDALYRFPFRYEDRRDFRQIASIKAGEAVSVRGTIVDAGVEITAKRRMRNYRLTLRDSSGFIDALWFNQSFLEKMLKVGKEVILFGTARRSRFGGGGLMFEGPDYEVMAPGEDEAVHMGALVPVYERLGELPPKYMRRVMHNLFAKLPERVPELLPEGVFPEAYASISRGKAFREIHFPENTSLELLNEFRSEAHRRLIFEEFFILQCGLLLRRAQGHERPKGFQFETSPELREILLGVLPFRLTGAQRKVFKDIVDDMTSAHPMSRLLQGDVGSGKTIVALLSMLIAVENGTQAAMMAPTEILAEQHYVNIKSMLFGTRYRVVLLTGKKRAKGRKETLEAIKNGQADIVVGTHAVIQEAVEFKKLGFVVVDEQHRFGVMQRQTLAQKGDTPDVLVMTATPIPRSLALTLYGDLDVSVIDELPPGRTPVETHVISEAQRARAYATLKKEIASGGQCYVVYPIIEESQKLNLKALTSMVEELRAAFPGERVEVLHGRMKSEEKEAVMAEFKAGKIPILASTTVIEVGVDVPNASLMLIENAERFGLAQLHQLRGRVGRGKRKSRCLLMAGEKLTEEGTLRLNTMESTNDGFKISDVDLMIRGPGDFFGTAQSGMPPLRVGNILRDRKLLEEARACAKDYLEALKQKTPASRMRELRFVTDRWKDKFGLVEVG